MSPSLFLVAWMGLTAAVLAQHSKSGGESLAALLIVLASAAAAFVEAGSLETGVGSKLRRPLQVLVFLLFLCCLGLAAKRELGL